MKDIEIALTNIGEIAARDIATNEHSYGLNENMKAAARGGKVANVARMSYEQETHQSAISSKNALPYQYLEKEQKLDSKRMLTTIISKLIKEFSNLADASAKLYEEV